MVKHVIIWQFKEGFTNEQKEAYKAEIKTGLEALAGKIPGLVDIKVYTSPLESSSGEFMLDSTFENEDALKAYQKNPDHLSVATVVRSVVGVRLCMDYEI